MNKNRALAMILLSVIPAFSFDGNRQGFILGGGIGPSLTTYAQELRAPSGSTKEIPRETRVGFATDFMIGYGFNDRFALVGFNKINWFQYENPYRKEMAVLVDEGIGTIIHLDQNASRAPYLHFGFGFSGWSGFSDKDEPTTPGIAVAGGIGFEIKAHYGIQLNCFYGNPSPANTPFGEEVQVSGLGFQFIVVAIAY